MHYFISKFRDITKKIEYYPMKNKIFFHEICSLELDECYNLIEIVILFKSE